MVGLVHAGSGQNRSKLQIDMRARRETSLTTTPGTMSPRDFTERGTLYEQHEQGSWVLWHCTKEITIYSRGNLPDALSDG